MFGIGGSELIFIILIAIMLFGADKIPEIARTMGKGIAQLKNATEDIKSEITKSAEQNGVDLKTITGGFNHEMEKVKSGFKNMIEEKDPEYLDTNSQNTENITAEIEKAKAKIDDLEDGPIKRQL
jgi:sec-independent protein translocase protein TatA